MNIQNTLLQEQIICVASRLGRASSSYIRKNTLNPGVLVSVRHGCRIEPTIGFGVQ